MCRWLRSAGVVLIMVVALVAAGCATGPSSADPARDPGGTFPAGVTNCGHEITFDTAPERVVVFRNEVVPVLSALGVLDRVVGLVGRFHPEYVDPDTRGRLEQIPVLSDRISEVGGGEVSLEIVLAAEPDLVIGTSATVTREALQARGIAVLDNEETCPGGRATSTLDDIDALFGLYADVFDRHDQAAAALAELDARVRSATADVPTGERRTAAMVYPSIGGGPVYAYGSGSINHTLLELAGFDDVFADVPDRTYEVSVEELLARDPDVLIVLHSGEEEAAVVSAIAALPGADGMTAVRNGELMPLLFGFTSPASPLVVDGLGRITERFAP